jgi:Ca2+-binding RTX toxin-like protein
VVVTDNLPANVTYVSAPVPAGFTATTPAVGATGTVTFTASSLAAHSSASFTIVVCVDSTVASNSTVSNTVTVTSLTPLTAGSQTKATVKAQVNVAGTSLVGSSLGNGKMDLLITGTSGSDSIYVLPTTGNQILVIEDGRVSQPMAAPTGRILIYSGNGNDIVYVSPLLNKPSWIFGGTGNDIFYADSGNSVLVGGSGNNVLFAGRGDNILIGGGGGRNIIMGTQGNNVEVGGGCSYETNEAALNAVMAEWSSTDSYAKRVGYLNDTITGGGGQNGSWYLDANTIIHGSTSDYLFGGIGQNAYFARKTGSVLARDYVFGQKSSEVVTSI